MAGKDVVSGDCLKVLVLADSRAFHTERYVRELRRQGCHAIVASLEHGKLHHYHLPRRGGVPSLHYLLAAPRTRALVRKFRPDVVNPHFVSGYGFLSYLAGVHRRTPVLLTAMGSDILKVPDKSRLHHRKTRMALMAGSHLVADSEFLLESADKLYPTRNHSIIPWGIERKSLDLHKSDYTLGKPLKVIVPRPHERVYNNLFIIRALAPLINEGKLSITFPRFGSLTDEFIHLAGTMVDDRYQTYTPLPREEYLKLAASHDVYLSSALSDSSPVSMIEAMGLGLIPIAANIPGVREWLNPDTGYLYESFSGEDLRSVIQGLISREDNHTVMRKKNMKMVLDRGVFEENITETINIMKSLVR
jgi:glycosyltransferase involved in cell wall biosynthesis